MSTTIKTYVGIFILMLSLFSMAGVLSACIDAGNARDFHASVIAEIEDSNFAPSVISSCKTQAANYILKSMKNCAIISPATSRRDGHVSERTG